MNKKELNKKKGKKKKKESKREYVLSLGLFILAVTFAFVFTLTNSDSSFQPSSSLTGYSIKEYSKLDYNSRLDKITDINGMNFSFSNGNILINDKRSLELVIESNQGEYSFEDPLFNSDKIKKGYNFLIEENIEDLIIKEDLIFNDKSPVKIIHSLKNNKNSKIDNITYYYVFDLFYEDELIINGSSCDYLGNCYYLGKDPRNRVNFNGEYDFVFDDLINTNFTLSNIKFQENKLWLGFSINISLNSGEEIELDPGFTTNAVDTLSITPIGTDKVIVAWEDVTERDASYAVYYLNGTRYGAVYDINQTLRWNLYASHGISVSAFNSTHFVVGYYNHQAEGAFFFNTRDINGVNISLINVLPGGGSYDNGASVSVSTFNSTHFVIAWTNDGEDDIEARVYTVTGTSASSLIEPDTNVGAGDFNSVSVATFNSTHFVISWLDDQNDDVLARVYSASGTPASSEITVESSTTGAITAHVDTLNSTHFAIIWGDNLEVKTGIYDARGNANTNIIDIVTNAQYDVAIASEDVATGIQLCGDNFAIAWIDNSSSASWGIYFPNGTAGYSPCNPISITINSPLNIAYDTNSITFNVTAVSSNSSISKCLYSLDLGSNISLTNSAGNFWSALDTLSDGGHNVTFYCNESANIWNTASVDFSIDVGNTSCGWWYNPAWSYRKNIIIDKDMVNGTQRNFPLYLNITDTSLKAYSQTDGDDILFTDVYGCNKLAHEIEYWDKTTGWLVAWIKVPVLSNTMVSIFDRFSTISDFFKKKPLFPNNLMVLPKVNGIDKASAQGQATINTATAMRIASVGSVKNQNIPAPDDTNNIINVKY